MSAERTDNGRCVVAYGEIGRPMERPEGSSTQPTVERGRRSISLVDRRAQADFPFLIRNSWFAYSTTED